MLYLRDSAPRLKPGSLDRLRTSLLHCVRHLGKLRVDRVTVDDVAEFHNRMQATPIAANRALVALHGLMKFAQRKSWRLDNPAKGVRYYREKPRERYLTADETARLARALAEAEGKESPFVLAAVKLLLLTGCRQGEIFGLRWSEVDLERGVIRLEDANTGAHVVYLNELAQDVLSALPRVEGIHAVPGWKKGANYQGEAEGLAADPRGGRDAGPPAPRPPAQLRQRPRLRRRVAADDRPAPWPQARRHDGALRPPGGLRAPGPDGEGRGLAAGRRGAAPAWEGAPASEGAMIERVSKLRTAHAAGDPGALLEALLLTFYTQPPQSPDDPVSPHERIAVERWILGGAFEYVCHALGFPMPGLQLPTRGRHGRWSTRILDEIRDLRIHWEVRNARAEGKTRDEAIAALAGRPDQEDATLAAYKRAERRLREDPHKYEVWEHLWPMIARFDPGAGKSAI